MEHEATLENDAENLKLLQKQIEDLASQVNHYEGQNNGNWKLAVRMADTITKRLEAEVCSDIAT